MLFQMENENDPTAYTKELKFGNLMLKRAKRELGRLDAQIRNNHEYGRDVSGLKVQFEQLQQSVEVFEHELAAYQLDDRDGIVSLSPT